MSHVSGHRPASSFRRSEGDFAPPADAPDEKFAKVFNQSYDMILILDPLDERIIDANPVACRKLEYSHDELLALSPATLHPDGIDRFKAFVAAVLDEGIGWSDEFECLTKTGNRLPTEISASRIELRGRPCMLAVVRDLTDRRRVEEELRRLSRLVVHALEDERRRVARDLHDSVNQLLSSVKFRVQAIAEGLGDSAEDGFRRQAQTAKELLDRAIQEVRLISHNLRPSELDDLGLGPAIGHLLDDFVARTEWNVDRALDSTESRLDPDVELTLYRITQEALSNIERHANASRVTVQLSSAVAQLELRIRDDGNGFDPRDGAATNEARGLGLLDMRERAAFVGGTFQIESLAGRGTEILVSVPLRPSMADDERSRP